MPQLTSTAVLQLVLLLSAVPAQYFISRWSGTSAAQRYHATTRFLRIWKEWRASVFNGTAWMEWANKQISKVTSLVGFGQENEEAPQSFAIESMMYDNDQGFFGASKEVRSPRPPYVFLRVGEVVLERKGHMVGVVVSWDPEMRALLDVSSRTFPLWKITSHILTGSGSSCSPGSNRSTLRTTWRTPDCSV